MTEFDSLFFSTWDDFPWNGPITCASLYAFCNEFQVKMYDIITAFSGPPGLRPDHHILRAGGPVVHCFKMLISSPDYTVCHFCSIRTNLVLRIKKSKIAKMPQIIIGIYVWCGGGGGGGEAKF